MKDFESRFMLWGLRLSPRNRAGTGECINVIDMIAFIDIDTDVNVHSLEPGNRNLFGSLVKILKQHRHFVRRFV